MAFIPGGTTLILLLSHMARWRKAIFIGRSDPDSGLDQYQKLAKLKRITLDIFSHTPNAAKYLPEHDVAFVSGYLTILEALAAGIPVLANYNNDIKKDYLLMAPFAEFIDVFSVASQAKLEFNLRRISNGRKWAQQQTWAKLAKTYEQLWRK